MKKPQKIILGITVVFLSLCAIFVYRFNLFFGETVFQKSLMAGCMYKVLKTENHRESRNRCECLIGSLTEKYSEEEITNNREQLMLEDEYLFDKCWTKNEISVTENNSIDTTKLYQKIGWLSKIDKDLSQEVEAYVSKKNDTIINQYKVFRNGAIDSSMSKFFEFKIEGYKDSLIQGEIRFYSPKDSTPIEKIEKREVIFLYLQRENDSLMVKEIKTDTNYVQFPYRNFDNYSFVGFILDERWISLDTSDAYLLHRNFFAIDSEVSTNNTFVELLK